MTPFKLSFYVALFAAMPVVIYQLWAFIAPGPVPAREALRGAAAGVVGAAVLRRRVLRVLRRVPGDVRRTWSHSVPIVVKMQHRHRPVPRLRAHDVLRLRRGVRSAGGRGAAGAHRHRAGRASSPKNRGYVLIGIFVIAAILTPPDALSQCIMAIPDVRCCTRAAWSWHASCRRCGARTPRPARKKKPKRADRGWGHSSFPSKWGQASDVGGPAAATCTWVELAFRRALRLIVVWRRGPPRAERFFGNTRLKQK